MEIITNQFFQLAAALSCGVFLGFFYDIYRLICHKFRLNIFWQAAADILWWLAVFCLLFLFWFFLSPGEMRLMVFFWQAVGFFLYRLYARSPVLQARRKIHLQVKEVRGPFLFIYIPFNIMGKIFLLMGRVFSFLLYETAFLLMFLERKIRRCCFYLFSLFMPENKPPAGPG